MQGHVGTPTAESRGLLRALPLGPTPHARVSQQHCRLADAELSLRRPMRIKHPGFLPRVLIRDLPRAHRNPACYVGTGHFAWPARCPWTQPDCLALRYVSLCDNEKTGCKARELKSVYVDAAGQFLRLVFHQNHANKYNIYNQVRLSPPLNSCQLLVGPCVLCLFRKAYSKPPLGGALSSRGGSCWPRQRWVQGPARGLQEPWAGRRLGPLQDPCRLWAPPSPMTT